MAGEYIWGPSRKDAYKKLMQMKPKTHKITILSRAPSLDNKYGNAGRAYYYIFDPKKRWR